MPERVARRVEPGPAAAFGLRHPQQRPALYPIVVMADDQ